MPFSSFSLCECCRASSVFAVRYLTLPDPRTGRRYQARLCAPCAQGSHGRDVCWLCRDVVWYCARVAHAAAMHPRLLEKLDNDPTAGRPPAAQTQPPLKKLGTLFLP